MWGTGLLDAELHSGSRSVDISLPDKGVHLVKGGPMLHSVAHSCKHDGRIAGKIGGALRAEPATVCILHTTSPETLNQGLWMKPLAG